MICPLRIIQGAKRFKTPPPSRVAVRVAWLAWLRGLCGSASDAARRAWKVMLDLFMLPARRDSSEHFRLVREATDEVLPVSVSHCEANLAIRKKASCGTRQSIT